MTSAKNQPILVELKNGETLNGELVNCDSWMNLTLNNVIQVSADGTDFLKLPECYVRGNHIKYMRLPEEVCILIIFLVCSIRQQKDMTIN